MSYSLLTWAVMPLLSVAAMAGMYGGAFQNRLFHQVEASIHAQYSSEINAFQKLAATMVEFFVPILDRSNISLHILGIHFLGLLMSAWILILIESYRRGPSDRSKSLVGGFGLLMEFMGVGVVIPWWCLVNLSSSYLPLLATPPPAPLLAPVPLQDAKLLPWSLLIGVGIPTLLMQISGLQTSVTATSKQFWIVARLFHPVFTLVVHRVLRGPAHRGPAVTPAESPQSARKIRTLLNAAFWVCAIPHCSIMTAIGVVNFFPEHFSAEIVRALAPQAIWPAASLWGKPFLQASSVKDGVATFLFWDEAVTAAAIVIWALVVNRVVLSKTRPGQTLLVIIKTLASSVLFGPSAAAVLLIQAKDDATLVQKPKVR